MSVFDKIQNYSANRPSQTKSTDTNKVQDQSTSIFNVSTPEGYFLNKLHQLGYKMYDEVYRDANGNTLSTTEYSNLGDSDKGAYTREVNYTELHNMLTTDGDQLVLANAGAGKALYNNELVMTPNGLVKIKDLKVGDMIYGTDLKTYKVKGVYPQGKKQVVGISVISNNKKHGRSIKCCKDHLWAIEVDGNVEVRTSSDIINMSPTSKNPIKLVNTGTFDSSLLDSIERFSLFFRLVKKTYKTRLVVKSEDRSKVTYYFGYSRCYDGDFDDIEKMMRNSAERSATQSIYENFFNKDGELDTPIGVVKMCRNECLYLPNSYYTRDELSDIREEDPDSKRKMQLQYDFSVEVPYSIYKWYLSNKGYIKVSKPLYEQYKTIWEDIESLTAFLDKDFEYYNIVEAKAMKLHREMTCIEVDSPNHLFLLKGLVPTHNTTALIFKIMHDIITGEVTKLVSIPSGESVRTVDSIWVSTFLKSGAEELQTRLASWQRGLGYTVTAGSVVFSTLHAEFKRALNAMGASTPIGTASDLDKCLKRAVDGLGITREGDSLKNEDYNIIASIIVYYRGRLDNQKYYHPSVSDYGLTPVILDRLVQDFARERQIAGIMDFEDLQELLYQFLYVKPNKAVQDFIANRYKYIYLDEFQDTSQMQYAILKFYARGRLWMNKGVADAEAEQSQLFTGDETKGKIIVVGDTDQCIYTWRGSDNNVMDKFFDADFRPVHSSLSYNYRCPSNILNAVVPSIRRNKSHEMREYRSSKEGGISRGYHFTSYKAMLNQLNKDIDIEMNEGNSLAILCRTNYDGVIPAFVLASENKYKFSISSKTMTLDSPLSRKIIAVSSIFTEKHTQAVKNTLSLFVPRYTQWKMKGLMDVLKNNNKSIWQIPNEDIEYSCPDLIDMIKRLKSIIFENGQRVQSKELDALKYVYAWLSVEVYGGDSLYCESARACIDALLYVLDNNDFTSVYEFVDYITDINERLHARIGLKNVDICIATVHEFKGKERDSVIVWNDSEGIFPSDKLDLHNEEEVEGERRVHYVACTRAKKKNTIYAIQGREGMFAKELDIEFINPQKVGGTLNSDGSDTDPELTEEEQALLDLISEADKE